MRLFGVIIFQILIRNKTHVKVTIKLLQLPFRVQEEHMCSFGMKIVFDITLIKSELLYLYCCINYMNGWGRLSHDIDFCRIFNSMSRIRLQIDQNLIKRGHIIENPDWRKEYGGRMGRIESRECGFDCLLGKDSKLFNFWKDF